MNQLNTLKPLVCFALLVAPVKHVHSLLSRAVQTAVSIERIWQIAILCTCLLLLAAAHGQGTTQYIYDANGRLAAVIAPNGTAAIYKYDSAGNLTSIEQLGNGAPSLSFFSPQLGTIGDQVTLTGVGLDSISSVSFNGVPAQILSASNSTLVTQVPTGASSGAITVSGPNGAATSASAFTVVAAVRITPSQAVILPGDSISFQASVFGTSNQQVAWAVNGTPGGNVSVGTIDSNGVYDSPRIDSGLAVTISATSQADTAVTGQASVDIPNPAVASRVISSGIAVAVGVGSAANVPVIASTVSVSVGLASPASAYAPALSVQFGPNAEVFSPAVSEQLGQSLKPLIAGVSPAVLSPSTSYTVTVTGQNLAGITQVSFLTPVNQSDGSVAISNLNISQDGTSMTFSANVGASASPGTDVVVVSGPQGQSSIIADGKNTIEIQ